MRVDGKKREKERREKETPERKRRGRVGGAAVRALIGRCDGRRAWR